MSFWTDTIKVSIASVTAYWAVPKAVKRADPLTGRLQPEDRWLETPDALGWGAGTYEPVIKKIYDEEGKEAALIAWLRRNKAYGMRADMRATPNYDTMQLFETGDRVPPKWGPWSWTGIIKDQGKTWFDNSYGISFGFAHIYLRSGWKLKPLFLGERPTDPNSPVGLFMGVVPRSDNWSDYPKNKAKK
jgi:hypothetical protein